MITTSSPRRVSVGAALMKHSRSRFCLAGCLVLLAWAARCEGGLAFWDFARGTEGWTTNAAVSHDRITGEGWTMTVNSSDPNLTGPPVDYPPGQFVTVTIRMRSNADPMGQIYHGPPFSESNSRAFVIHNDGLWHEYSIPLPPMAAGTQLRLDPSHQAGSVAVAWIRVETHPHPRQEPWARPQELRGKKSLGGGQFGTAGGENAVTSRYLASHPEFAASFPFDGYVIPAVLPVEWGERLGLAPREYFLHELLWNTVELPSEAIDPIVADLNSVHWGTLSDNFLNCTLIDGARGRFTPDLSNDQDWAIVEHNAAMAARLCREAHLQGFWLDTEQYGNYRWRTKSGVPEFETDRPPNLKFPFGKDSPALLRRRGAQWIKAVQAQLPAVKIIVTFAWSPDAVGYEPLQGSIPFLDGVLDAIEHPGQLIHGYENTFYYGQGPGTLNAANDGKPAGFAGDRGRYEAARAWMREWRSLSGNPPKYDQFVKTGMAAWIEDDPWSLYPGWPSGTKTSFWANLPLALASSDEYVWIWSEHTHYGQTPAAGINPFLAAIANRTFNTGTEAALTLAEDFASDPLQRGWHFDFDMLDIGRKANPAHEVPLMSPDTVPYVWSQNSQAVAIKGRWPTARGSVGTAAEGSQRRRYVHPIRLSPQDTPFQAALDFRVESFGNTPNNPIVMGFFSADESIERQSLTLQIASAEQVRCVLASNGKSTAWDLAVPGGMKAGQPYRFSVDYARSPRSLRASLSDLSGDPSLSVQIEQSLPASTVPSLWDELGVALWEKDTQPNTDPEAYHYRLEKVSLRH